MATEKSIQIAISVKPKLLSFMKEVAETRGVSFSEMIRTGFERYYFEIYAREKAGYKGADQIGKNEIKTLKKEKQFELDRLFGPGTEDIELENYLLSINYINDGYKERTNSDLYIGSIDNVRGLVASSRSMELKLVHEDMNLLKQNVLEFISNKK